MYWKKSPQPQLLWQVGELQSECRCNRWPSQSRERSQMVSPFPLIEVSGQPFERGVQHGRKAKDRIRAGITHYLHQLKQLSLEAREVNQLVREYRPVIENFDPTYVEEIRGIAEGSGFSFEDICLLNARTEILKLGERPAL